MAKKWYVLHTYSGYENKVRQNLEQRIESMGLEHKVFKIEIPTEKVTEIKEGGKRVETEKKVLPGVPACLIRAACVQFASTSNLKSGCLFSVIGSKFQRVN